MSFRQSLSIMLVAGSAVALSLGAIGCSTQAPSKQDTRLVWPPPPEKTRIEFVRTISSQADLAEDTTFSQSVKDFVTGTKPTPADIVEPNGIAVSDDGSVLYVSDRAQGAVFKFDFANKKFKRIGQSLDWPIGVAVDPDGNVYVAEQGKKAITAFDRSGKEIRSFTDKSLERPSGIAIDPKRRVLYVADTAHTKSEEHNVKIFTLDGKLIGKIGKGKGDAPGYFLFPTYVWVDGGGHVYVTDSLNCRVQEFTSTGEFVRSFGKRGDAWGQFTRPKGVALDQFGNVYVVDSGWSNVQIFNHKGQILLFFGGRGPIPGMLKNPTAIAIDHNNDIFVGDYLNHRVEEYRLVNTTSSDSYQGEAAGSTQSSAPTVKPAS